MNFSNVILIVVSAAMTIIIAITSGSRMKRFLARLGDGPVPMRERFLFFLCAMVFAYFVIALAIFNPLSLPAMLDVVAAVSGGVIVTLLFVILIGCASLASFLLASPRFVYAAARQKKKRLVCRGMNLSYAVTAVIAISLWLLANNDVRSASAMLVLFLIFWSLSAYRRRIVSGWRKLVFSFYFIRFIRSLSDGYSLGRRSDDL